MPVHKSYIQEEGRLDLSFCGNLDVTVSQDIFDICQRANPRLRSCIVDLTEVERVFDSGIALIQMLYRHLSDLGTTVVVLSDHPEICERIPVHRPQSYGDAPRLSAGV